MTETIHDVPSHSEETTPLVYSIVVNYQAPDDTIRCLDSLRAQEYPNQEVVVINNDDDITGANKIRRAHPEATVIYTGENLGFSSGFNIGIEYALRADADYISILNNDIILDEQFLETTIETFRTKDNVGMVGGKIYKFDDRKTNSVWAAGGRFSWLRGKGVAYGSDDNREIPREVDFIAGSQMFVRREVFETVGLLPEAYFLGGEEWDFCKQVRSNDYKILYDPDVVAWHEVGHTGEKSYARYYNLFRNKIIFTHRHYSSVGWVTWLLVFVLYMHSVLWYQYRDENPTLAYRAAVDALRQSVLGPRFQMSRTEFEEAVERSDHT